MDDRQLINRIREGDQSALYEIYEKFKKPVLFKLRRAISTCEDDREDLAHDVFVALFACIKNENFSLERYQSVEQLVWGITKNLLRGWYRDRKRYRNTFVHGLQPVNGSSCDCPTNQWASNIAVDLMSYSAEDKVCRREKELIVRRRVEQLRDKYRHVLKMRYELTLSIEEISEMLQLPRRRVSERINYALKLLKKELKKPAIADMLEEVQNDNIEKYQLRKPIEEQQPTSQG